METGGDCQGCLAPSNRAAPSPMAVSLLDCNCWAGGRRTCDCPNRDNSWRETFSQRCGYVGHVVLPSPPERNLAQPPRGLSRCQAARPRTGEGVSGMVAESCCFSHVDEGDGSGHALQLTTGGTQYPQPVPHRRDQVRSLLLGPIMQPIDQGSHLLRHIGIVYHNGVPLILVLDGQPIVKLVPGMGIRGGRGGAGQRREVGRLGEVMEFVRLLGGEVVCVDGKLPPHRGPAETSRSLVLNAHGDRPLRSCEHVSGNGDSARRSSWADRRRTRDCSHQPAEVRRGSRYGSRIHGWNRAPQQLLCRQDSDIKTTSPGPHPAW